MINQTMGATEWVLLLFLSFLWGASYLFIGIALKDMDVFSIVTGRVLIAALILWLLVLVTGKKIPRNPEIWISFLIMGLLNNAIPFSLIVAGQSRIAPGLALILNATTPLFTVLAAGFFLEDEKIVPRKILGVLIGFFGVAIMMGISALYETDGHVLFQLLIIGGAISYSLGGVFGRRFKKLGVDPILTATGQLTGSSLILLLIEGVHLSVSPVSIPSPGSIAAYRPSPCFPPPWPISSISEFFLPQARRIYFLSHFSSRYLQHCSGLFFSTSPSE